MASLLPCTTILAEGEKVHQKEFIVHLVTAMKLDSALPINPQITDYIKLLEERGITIPGGYNPDELITAKQMAIMLIPAMGLNRNKFDEIKRQIDISYKDKAVIINITGDVKVRMKETNKWDLAKPGLALNIEDTIKTGGNSSAVIRLGQISVAKVKENTTVAVYQLAKNPIIYIEEGDVLIDSGTPHTASYYVITPTAVTAVRGTVIDIMYRENSTKILLAEGKADVYNVAKYSTTEKVAMAKDEKFAVAGLEITKGMYFKDDKLYPLTEQEIQSIYDESKEIKTAMETDIGGAAAEKMLEEEGIKDEDYLKIDIIENRDKKQYIAKAEKTDFE
jgi:hypothetical protein